MKRHEKLAQLSSIKVRMDFFKTNMDSIDVNYLLEKNRKFDKVLHTLDSLNDNHKRYCILDGSSSKIKIDTYKINDDIEISGFGLKCGYSLHGYMESKNIDMNFKNIRNVVSERKKKIVKRINFLNEEV